MLTLKVDGAIGSSPEQCAEEIAELAGRLGVCVDLKFNDLDMFALPGEDLALVMQRFRRMQEVRPPRGPVPDRPRSRVLLETRRPFPYHSHDCGEAMKRIRVPEFLVSAVMSSPLVVAACNGKAVSISEPVAREVARRICEALSEHPQVPTDYEAEQLYFDWRSKESRIESVRKWVDWWQRRCFVQEEPEIPAELKELLLPLEIMTDMKPTAEFFKTFNDYVEEAYRRGLRKGEQK